MPSPAEVRNALADVQDPEYPVSLVDLGLVRDVKVSRGKATVAIATSASCGPGPHGKATAPPMVTTVWRYGAMAASSVTVAIAPRTRQMRPALRTQPVTARPQRAPRRRPSARAAAV